MSIKIRLIKESDVFLEVGPKPYWTLETEEKLEVLRLKLNEIIEVLQEKK